MEEIKKEEIELDFGEGGIVSMREYLDALIEETEESMRLEGKKEDEISARVRNIRSGYNSIFRVMVKKHNRLHPDRKIKFNDLMEYDFIKLSPKIKEFQEKYGISNNFHFLGK